MDNRDELKELLTGWRHSLHENPETAFEEVKTAAFIAENLRKMGIEVVEGVGKTGVIGTLKCGTGEKIIGIRADMDAINLEETGTQEYRSKIPGKMHGCGHDGHVATLLGAAKLLSERRNFDGTVRFIFQPAEEPGKGSQAMIDDGFLERFPMDEIYGMHNMPSLYQGKIGTKVGGIMASEDNFTVEIQGKGGHASSPHMGIDPLVAASQVILGFQTIVSRNANPLESAVISCTEIFTDGAHNAIPSNVKILGDTRSFSPEMQKLIETRMEAVAKGVCQAAGAQCEFTYTHEFVPTLNWDRCVANALKAAENTVGVENVDSDCQPWMASEDFGRYLEKIPGCYVFLGSGRSADSEKNVPLHNSEYDYNDEILVIGAEFLAELARVCLPEKEVSSGHEYQY